MDKICLTCAAVDRCPNAESDVYDEDVCEQLLSEIIEDARREYREAWYKYIDKFYFD